MRELSERKFILLQQLRARCVMRVEIEYSGCGDEGNIDEISFIGNDGTRLLVPDMVAQVDEWANDFLQEKFSGWEDGDGAYGIIAIRVGAGKVKYSHNIPITNYETEEGEF